MYVCTHVCIRTECCNAPVLAYKNTYIKACMCAQTMVQCICAGITYMHILTRTHSRMESSCKYAVTHIFHTYIFTCTYSRTKSCY